MVGVDVVGIGIEGVLGGIHERGNRHGSLLGGLHGDRLGSRHGALWSCRSVDGAGRTGVLGSTLCRFD